MKSIPIFFSFDNNYVEPAAVAFFSLLNKAKKNVFYEMYVLHSDITEEKQNLLLNVVNKKGNARLRFIDTNSFLSEFWDSKSFNFKEGNSTFTVDTVIRCFGAGFFPQYDKIIYSDVDVVVVDDISEIYDIDLEDKYITGVRNAFSEYSKRELDHLKQEHYEMLHDRYIAGGIWVMNLKKIREDNLEKRMIEVIRDKTIVKRWNDQDIINISCGGKVGFIPLNYISYPYLLDLLRDPKFKSDYTREELYDSIINPKIIHYAASKPWNSSVHHSLVWWTIFDYLKLEKTSIFKDEVAEKASPERLKTRKYRKLFKLTLILLSILLIVNIILWTRI